MKRLIFIALFFAHLLAFSQPMKDVIVHDPVMIKHGETYYMFATGMGISVYSSKDMENWTNEPPVFNQPPSWTQSVVDGFKGHIWAPDISFFNGKYYLYYSVSAFAKNTSAIGLAINNTLDPKDPNFKWEDQGIVVQSEPNRDLWNAIDPNIITDENNTAWMTFGSFWEGLKLVRLSEDRKSVAKPEQWFTVAKRTRSEFIEDSNPGDAALEAPFIFKKDSMYYLFASWDYCCRGAKSNYKVVVGRSLNITGPYLDKNGISLTKGGGSTVIEGNARWAGIGHNSVYHFGDKDYFVCHAYDVSDNGRPKLKIAEITWDALGWPMVSKSIVE
jgi:arabinan endo-1,5-alpha-L-arabinosidase